MSTLPWTLTMDELQYQRLHDHLFPGDHDEHGAVLACGIVRTDRGTRLLVREVFLAKDGVDFVPGKRGYRRLTAGFVGDRIRYCRDQELTYLAVHNHGGTETVGFSDVDNASHERGYPALLDISQRPVGAVVFADQAVAGDIWTEDRQRRPLSEMVVLGRNIVRLYPEPLPRPPKADAMYDRQVRWFGDRGQALLGQLKVGVIGAGGVGLPLSTMLARFGVGTVVSIDPDRVDDTNLPRLEANRWDAMMALRRLPVIGTTLADRLSIKKVLLARRLARRANPKINFVAIPQSVIEPSAARELIDCDFLFLAADSHLARMVFNAVTHQYLIPGVQIGTRIDVDKETGQVGDIRTNLRLVVPSNGCLRCRGKSLIDPARLQAESLGQVERERNRYVDEVPAPSVITFNTAAAGLAANDFLLMMGELMEPSAPLHDLRLRPRQRKLEPVISARQREKCPDCGTASTSRRARGDAAELPLPQR